MFTMDNIKIVAFDYDEVLCIHDRRDLHKDTQQGRIDARHKGVNFYDNGNFHKSNVMEVFINRFCRGKETILLSATRDESFFQMKLDWAEKQYLHNFVERCVQKRHSKVPMLMSVCKEFNVEPDQVLLVDDNIETLAEAQSNNFEVATPLDIADYIYGRQ